MKKGKIRSISYVLWLLLIFCMFLTIGFGFSGIPIPRIFIETDNIPLFVLNIFFGIWFLSILSSFALPVIKRLREEKGEEVSEILFGSGILATAALFSLIVFMISVFSYLFYIGLRCGTFHAS